MNRIYKVIWSKAKHCYVVASELAKRNGKSAQKAVVGAVIAGVLGVGVLGLSSSAMAANDYGYSYDAAAMLTAVTHDDNTGLGFAMVRGDFNPSALNNCYGIEKDGNQYKVGTLSVRTGSGNTNHFTLNDSQTFSSIEAAYQYAAIHAAASTHKDIYFGGSALTDYLTSEGYSKQTVDAIVTHSDYRYTLVEAEASAEFNKELIKETQTMVYNTVGQVLQPGENVAVEKAGYLTLKDAAGNIQYVDKDGNVIKDESGEVITTPIAELTDD